MSIKSKIKFNIRQLEKELMQHVMLPMSYTFARSGADEKYVTLADCHHEECPDDLKLIAQELRKRGKKVRGYFFDIDRNSGIENLRKMLTFMKLYKKSSSVFLCTYFLPAASCHKKKGTTVVNVWHGCGAFKKFGYDSKEDIPKNYVGNPFANTDIMTVSGRKCIEPFASAMSYKPAQVLDLGCSITDLYYDEAYKKKCMEKFRRIFPEAEGKKVILYAPTFRKNAAFAEVCGEDYIDRLIADEDVSKDYYIIKSVHPNSKKHRMEYENANQMSSRELMIASDLLITDYSSIFFEYLLLDKPMIFFAPDYGEYMKDRGLYLDYHDLPGVIITDADDDMYAALKNALKTADESSVKKRNEFRSSYMNGCDGHATEKIIDEVESRQRHSRK